MTKLKGENLAAIVLAAGRGVRMQSDLPKVFNYLAGKPLLAYVIGTLKKLGIQRIYVVVGHKKELIMDYFKDWGVAFVEQKEQLGTGHAVQQARSQLSDFRGRVLVLAGDVPLLRDKTLQTLVDFHVQHHSVATVLTAELPDAGNYGRIVRNQEGLILKIVEKKDATPEELKIREINTGTFCFESRYLFAALSEIKCENVQREYYLTDTIEILRAQGQPVFACLAPDYRETLGVNTREELQQLANLLHRK
jgi:UDP-N-acetylglucosamine diphosphorylase/glucosamine-1-phosphate N-acetyltransferase